MAVYDATQNLMMCEACAGTGNVGQADDGDLIQCGKCGGDAWVEATTEQIDFGLLFLAEKAAIVAQMTQMAEASGYEFIGPAPVYGGAA